MTGDNPRPSPQLDAVSFFDAEAKKYEAWSRESPRFTERFAVWDELMDTYAKPAPSSRCLDLGCGVGTLSRRAASRGFQTLGLDGSPSMIELSRSLSAETPGQLEFREATFPLSGPLMTELASSVDLLLASSIIEYMGDGRAFMRQCEQLLRPEGIAVISFPNATSIYRRVQPLIKLRGSNYLRMRAQQYTERSAAELARAMGLEVLETRFFAFPFLRLSSVIKRRSPLVATMFALVLRKA
jgi:2-polyprenyl-3-methyl-5-hydroxy-6-metoxy-1,4-benzoquinol methylase